MQHRSRAEAHTEMLGRVAAGLESGLGMARLRAGLLISDRELTAYCAELMRMDPRAIPWPELPYPEVDEEIRSWELDPPPPIEPSDVIYLALPKREGPI